ncbi:hypothetical protein BKA67DRAFT_656042 [Truncatella angustata]|uniref:Uncharacterized protein n=1 Tax=Truncatella angustata TaxID=152316 RepID=A0A9P9A2C0_9PEZI|nr:uncharacterized protein BKA67DRAFT_656042 [Truncatella angustata]KAH6657800.1 hypothetical protein BKA67DRAFT_656042 [Truncatella angustata]
MCGKLTKDFGQFKEAYNGLKEFCEVYVGRGSREEVERKAGTIGDLGQLILKLQLTNDAVEILADLAANGVSFEEKVELTEHARACDISAYVLPRAIYSRMFERGYVTSEARKNAKDGDIVWLEIIHGMTLTQ